MPCCGPFSSLCPFGDPLSTFIYSNGGIGLVVLSSLPQNYLWLASRDTEEWLRSRASDARDLKGLKLRARRLAFDLVVRAMAYENLRDRMRFPPLETLEPKERFRAFRKAAQATGLPFLVPADDLASELIRSPIARIAAKASKLLQADGKNSFDVIGDLYLQVFPSAIRKRQGEFYTPSRVSSLMTDWAVRSAHDVIMDPAVGSGNFLLHSGARLESFGASPEECAAHLVGIDINPTSCLMTLANLAALIRGPLIHLVADDFFSIHPHGKSLLPETLTDIDAVICNPPYSRHHEMNSKRKEELARLIEVESGVRLSRLTSLYVHFMIHAAAFLRPGGRLAFLTPAEYMDVNYGRALRAYLLENFQIDAFVLFPREGTLFRDALTTSCVTLATRGAPGPDHLVRFVRVLGSPSAHDLQRALAAERPVETSEMSVTLVAQAQLGQNTKWSPLFFGIGRQVTSSGPRLSEVASVRRGIATGANGFFTVNEETIETWGLEAEFLTPIIPHARSVLHYDFTEEDWKRLKVAGERVWMVSSRRPLVELKGTNVRRYLEWGDSNGFSRRYIPSHREPWYSAEGTQPKPILFTYMGRRRPRFVLNESGAVNLNNLHGVTPLGEFLGDPVRLRALLAVANGQMSLEDPARYGRTYGGGLTKFEPSEVENLPLPVIRSLRFEVLTKLAGGFDELCSVSRGGDQAAVIEALGRITSLIAVAQPTHSPATASS